MTDPPQNQMSMSLVIQKADATLGRKSEQLIEVAEQIAEAQKMYMQIVQFYETNVQKFLANMHQLKEWGEAQEKLIADIQTKVSFPIELPKKPEFLTNNNQKMPSPPPTEPQGEKELDKTRLEAMKTMSQEQPK